MRVQNLCRVILCLVTAAIALGTTPRAFSAEAKMPKNKDLVMACASFYAYFRDTSGGTDGLLRLGAQLGNISVDAARNELLNRLNGVKSSVRNGTLSEQQLLNLAKDSCPTSYDVPPVKSSFDFVSSAAETPPPPYCVGVYHYLEAAYNHSPRGPGWAWEEMSRRAAKETGATMNDIQTNGSKNADGYNGAQRSGISDIATFITKAVQCQNKYDVPIPPGAVIGAVKTAYTGDVTRGRMQYCAALANDFNTEANKGGDLSQLYSRDPSGAQAMALKAIESMKFYALKMDAAHCPRSTFQAVQASQARFGEQINNYVNDVADQYKAMTATMREAQQR